MTQTAQPNDSKLAFIKFSRVLVYLVYGFALVASGFLALGFVLLLFSANTSTPFVDFVYQTAQFFLAPFRGIFPLKQVSDTGYFSPSALFAILMYSFLAMGMHALINYVTFKMVQYQNAIDDNAREVTKPKSS